MPNWSRSLEEARKAEEAAWPEFRDRVLAVRSYADALRLIAEMPGPDTPPRRFYTAFRFFIESGRRPNTATDREWALYRTVAQTLVDSGDLKPEALDVFTKGTGDAP